MHPRSIQSLILVRTAEEADKKGGLIPFSKREEASQQALLRSSPGEFTGGKNLSNPQWRFLEERAEFLRDQSQDVVGGDVSLPFETSRIGMGLCLIAFFVGFASHIAGLSRSFDLLAGPFLLVFLWNAFVYAFVIHRAFRQSGPDEKNGLVSQWIEKKIRSLDGEQPANAARHNYVKYLSVWLRSWAPPLITSWFHAGSACFALGLLVAIYFRGLYTGYLAGWESTWLDAGAVSFILGYLLGPASWVSGIPLPQTLQEWSQLERLPGYAGVKAAPWIHLYAITMIAWVVIPRLVLCVLSHVQATRLRGTPPAWSPDDPYLRRILGLVRQDGDFSIAILPFDIKNPDTIRQGAYRDAFERLAREAWGQGARPCWLECAPYGSEEDIWDTVWAGANWDGALLLFDMQSTPEEEVHGFLVDAVVKRFGESRGGVMIVIESSRVTPDRYESRLALWRQLAQKKSLGVLPVDAGITRETGTIPSSLLYHST